MIHQYNRNIKRRWTVRRKGGEFGGDNRAGLGGRQHSERGAGKSGGLRATHELHKKLKKKKKITMVTSTGETDATVAALTEFGALRCFTVKNQSTIIRGYLTAIRYYQKNVGVWGLPTDHREEIDRAHTSRFDAATSLRKI